MVDITKFDISILVVMTLAIVIMSFMFPALGMTENGAVNESDVPQFNASQSSFDLTGDTPDRPRTSDSGELVYDQDGAGASVEGVSLIYLEEPKIEGFSIEVFNASSGPQITAINWSDTDSDGVAEAESQNDYPINNDTSQTILHDANGYVIEFSVETIENYNDPDMRIVVNYQIESSPDDSKGVSSLPIIGDTADLVATVLGYLVTMFSYFSLVLVEVVLNTLITVALLSSYLVKMSVFMASTYASIISSSPSWAAVVLTIPSVLVSAIFAKLIYVVIKAFPTT